MLLYSLLSSFLLCAFKGRLSHKLCNKRSSSLPQRTLLLKTLTIFLLRIYVTYNPTSSLAQIDTAEMTPLITMATVVFAADREASG